MKSVLNACQIHFLGISGMIGEPQLEDLPVEIMFRRIICWLIIQIEIIVSKSWNDHRVWHYFSNRFGYPRMRCHQCIIFVLIPWISSVIICHVTDKVSSYEEHIQVRLEDPHLLKHPFEEYSWWVTVKATKGGRIVTDEVLEALHLLCPCAVFAVPQVAYIGIVLWVCVYITK